MSLSVRPNIVGVQNGQYVILLQILLLRAQSLSYKRIGACLYKPHINYWYTAKIESYDFACSVQDFIVSSFPTKTITAKNLVRDKDTMEFLAAYLTLYSGPFLPLLEPDPKIFVFLDGVFDNQEDQFIYSDKALGRPWIGDVRNMKCVSIFNLDKMFDWETIFDDVLSARMDADDKNPELCHVYPVL